MSLQLQCVCFGLCVERKCFLGAGFKELKWTDELINLFSAGAMEVLIGLFQVCECGVRGCEGV